MLAFTLALVAVTALPLQQANADPVTTLATFGAAFVATTLLGTVKKVDVKITQAPIFRKLQPFIALGLTVGGTWVSQRLGAPVDPAAFTAAPLATLTAIGASELFSLVTRKR